MKEGGEGEKEKKEEEEELNMPISRSSPSTIT
jgi:hypothetical protein